MVLREHLFPGSPSSCLQLATNVATPDLVQATIPLLNLVVESVDVALEPLGRHLSALGESAVSLPTRVEDLENQMVTQCTRVSSLRTNFEMLNTALNALRMQASSIPNIVACLARRSRAPVSQH